MENVAGEQGLALQQPFPYKSSCSLKNSDSFSFFETWPFWYFRCALSNSGILQVVAHNIKIFKEKCGEQHKFLV